MLSIDELLTQAQRNVRNKNSSCKPKPVSSNKKVDPAAIRRLKLKKEEDERRKAFEQKVAREKMLKMKSAKSKKSNNQAVTEEGPRLTKEQDRNHQAFMLSLNSSNKKHDYTYAKHSSEQNSDREKRIPKIPKKTINHKNLDYNSLLKLAQAKNNGLSDFEIKDENLKKSESNRRLESTLGSFKIAKKRSAENDSEEERRIKARKLAKLFSKSKENATSCRVKDKIEKPKFKPTKATNINLKPVKRNAGIIDLCDSQIPQSNPNKLPKEKKVKKTSEFRLNPYKKAELEKRKVNTNNAKPPEKLKSKPVVKNTPSKPSCKYVKPTPQKLSAADEYHRRAMKAASAQGRRFNPHAISRKIGRVFDDSEDEYDPEMSEFIDDEGDDLNIDISHQISTIFGYDRHSYGHESEYDLSRMDVGFKEIDKEEKRSLRIAKKEDAEAAREEEEMLKRKMKAKKRR